jgi:hypothetical protein
MIELVYTSDVFDVTLNQRVYVLLRPSLATTVIVTRQRLRVGAKLKMTTWADLKLTRFNRGAVSQITKADYLD